MTRFKAFSIHLGISLVIFFVLAYFVLFQWYPGIFFEIDGGWRGMRIIFAVDLVLGPLLTLVVFKANKPGLKFDLTAIGVVQFVCLFAGTYVVYDERPIAVVYTDGRFTVTSADDYRKDADTVMPDLSGFPGKNPKWVMVQLPEDEQEEAELRANSFRSGTLLSSRTELFVPFSPDTQNFINESVSLEKIRVGERWGRAVDEWVKEHGGEADDYRFYTFTTRYTYSYLVFDAETNKRIGFLTTAPKRSESVDPT